MTKPNRNRPASPPPAPPGSTPAPLFWTWEPLTHRPIDSVPAVTTKVLPTKVLPTKALPTKALPTKVPPTKLLPENVLPEKALPQSIPTGTLPTENLPTENLPPEKVLIDAFLQGGYVRRFSQERRAELPPAEYKKGGEVRLSLRSDAEVTQVQRALATLGLRMGRPYRKHQRIVQPVYGEDAVKWFLDRLSSEVLAERGFAPDGTRLTRRTGQP